MNQKKNVVSVGLIYLILFTVFNLLVFVIFKERTGVFWVSYAFMTLAFIVQLASIILSFRHADVETAFFGIPLASLSIYYLCVSLVVGFIFMFYQRAGTTLALVLQVLILAAFLVVAILALMSRDAVQEISDNIQQKVVNLKSVLVDVEMVRESCTDPEFKEKLRKLSETVKYSDPMTNDVVYDIEQRILRRVSELRYHVDNAQLSEADQACRDLESLYIERNKKLMISK